MIIIKENIKFYKSVMSQGKNKGQLNTTRKKIKFIMRSLVLLPHTNKVGNFLRGHKFLSKTIYEYPMLVSKIHRPYLCNSFKINKKVDSIIDHYKYIDNYFNIDIIEKLYFKKKIELAEIEGKNESKFKLILSLYPNFDKEGEMNISLLNENKDILAILTFSFIKENNRYSIFIGGLQGASKGIDHVEIKEATKNLFGLFPKKIVIEALFFLEKSLGVKLDKIAVSTAQHIYLANRYKAKKQRTVHADYNKFWESLEGKVYKNIFYLLPKELKRKDILEVPSKKRNQYRKRFSILEDIEFKVLSILNKKIKN